MRVRFFLPVLAIALFLSACSNQAGPATASTIVATDTPVSTSPSTPVPLSTDTPVPTATDTPMPPPLPILASPALIRINFQDENNGWAMAANDKGLILRTVDGGLTWLNATPPGMDTIGYSAILTVLNTSSVWVLVPGVDYFSGTLYRTNDGGVTWDSNPVPFGGGFLQFLDANTGRALAAREARAGSEAVELFQSSDGGATWVSIFHNDSSQPGSSGSLPLAGIKNGMTFLDAKTGWVTGSIPEDGEVYLYVTRDGGASWAQQSLPLPAAYAAYRYLPQAPVFYGKDGFLPLTIYKPDLTDFTVYTTHDGGLSWSGDPADPYKTIKPGLPAFADSLHGWSWDGGARLNLTSDGAQSWQAIPATQDLSGRLAQMEFLPAPSGHFTGWALSRADEAGHSQLYRTSDGSTWMPVIP